MKMGYLKLVQREDERQAAMAGLMTKQLTQPGLGFEAKGIQRGASPFLHTMDFRGPNLLTFLFLFLEVLNGS